MKLIIKYLGKVMAFLMMLMCSQELMAYSCSQDDIDYHINIGRASSNIAFADARVKALCVQNWDTNGDGELSESEAAAVTSLNYVFRGDSTITSFNELEYFVGLQRIISYAFQDCKKLSSVSIPNSVVDIRGGAFTDCIGLESVTFGNSVETIDDYAFRNCIELKSVELPNTLTTIDYGVFYGCSGLESVTIPSSVIIIDERAFYECTGLKRVNINDIEAWHNINFGSLSNPLMYAHHLYLNGSEVTTLTIPNTVDTISNAFAYCTDITTVIIPNSVVAIGKGAFAGFTGLNDIEIPNSVTYIGNEAFSHTGLASVTIPESVTNIGYGAFHYSDNLINVYSLITDPSLISMGSDVFYQYPATYSNRTLHVPIGSVPSYRASSKWNPYFGNIVEIGGNSVLATSITLNKSVAVMAKGETLQLIASVLPDNTTNKSVMWNSSDNSIATVNSNGLVTAKSIGTATITATTTDGSNLSASCSITVSNNSIITFIDTNVKAICVQNWDTNGDGELSEAEAAAVPHIGLEFKGNTTIQHFDELQYFTGLSYISSNAFESCNLLESIKIPISIKSIYSYTFSNCSSLKNINIHESIVSIGSYAFWHCTQLQNVTIPNSVTSIGKYAFSGCDGLMSVIIGNSVTSIEKSTFSGCDNLTTISMGESITTIGQDAFSYCPSLISVEIPNSVKSISLYAFYECTGLKSLKIGNSVTDILDYAFKKCNALETVTCAAMIPPEIDSETFSSYSAKLIVPRSSVNLYKNADYWKKFNMIVGFYDFEQDGIYYNIIDKTNKKVEVTCRDESYNSYSGSLSIPSTVQFSGTEYLVSRIGMNAFRDCVNLTSLAFPNSITTIASSAFYNCVELGNISLPESITSIGQSAFVNCAKLTSVEIPNAVTSIGDYAFQGCDAISLLNFNAVLCADFSSTASHRPFYNLNIKTINIGDSVQKIPAYFAYGLTKLDNLTIGKAVTSIGDYGFQGCTALKTINFNAESCGNFNSYDSSPFYNLNITTINIGNSVQKIPSYFAYGLSNLVNIEIPNTIIYIGYNAFYGCSNLEKVYITDIASWCKINFYSSTANPLTYAHHLYLNGVEVSDLVLPNTISDISSCAFYGCTSLTSITIPKTVTSIGSSAFCGCTSLTEMNFNAISCADFNSSYNPFSNTFISSIIIGDDVVRIPDNFTKELTTLRTVTIGNSVTSIGNSAFYGCTSLTDISMGSSVATIGASAFYKCTGLTGITFNDKVTTIYNSAFYGCTGLKSIELPSSVRTISSKAFYNCSGLSSVYSFASNPPVMESSDCFTVYNVATLFVPYEVLDTYKNTYYWNNFYRAYGVDPEGNVLVTGISLNESNKSLNVNQTFILNATITPDCATNQTVVWSSSNSNVATVDSTGLVTAYAEGNTIITATTTDGTNLSASCTVSVSSIPVTSISLNKSSLTLDINETYQLIATVYPSNASNNTLTWSTSNSEVATVTNDGLINPVSLGDVTITVMTTDGTNLSASCQVTVLNRVQEITLNVSSLSLTLPETAQLIASITPSDATNPALNWTSSKPSVAGVDNNGFVTSVGVGTAIIKVSTTDGSNLSASCQVTVNRQYVTSITLNESNLVMHIGDTYQLIAEVQPENASNPSLSWSTGNSSIASVDNNGLVTAKSPGTTYIQAKTSDGSSLTARCTIEVVPDYYITLDTLSHIRGSSVQIVDLPVSLVNKNPISGIQFDVSLPNDVEFNIVDGLPDVWLDDARGTRSHSISVSQISNGNYRVLVTSATSKDLRGNDGELVHMNMLLPQHHDTGNRYINISNIIASEADETRHTLDNKSTVVHFYYIVGDADANSYVDIADHAATASRILGKNPSPFYYDAANVDANNSLDVVDLVGITNIALGIKPITVRQAPIWGGVENRLFCERLKLNAGGEQEIAIGMDCSFDFAGFQMDVSLPRGLQLIDSNLGEEASNLGLVTEKMADGRIRILGTSFSDAEVDGICHQLLTFKVRAEREYVPGSEIAFTDILFAERNLTAHSFDGSYVEYIEPSCVYELMEDARIYVENGNIIIDTPMAGTMQLIAVDGHMVEYEAQIGHNVYEVGVSGIYIIHFNGKTLKVRL